MLPSAPTTLTQQNNVRYPRRGTSTVQRGSLGFGPRRRCGISSGWRTSDGSGSQVLCDPLARGKRLQFWPSNGSGRLRSPEESARVKRQNRNTTLWLNIA